MTAPISSRSRAAAAMALPCALALLVWLASPQPVRAATEPASEPSRIARFDVYEYRIDGNTVLGTEAIERAVYPYLGEQRSIDDVEAARAALDKAFKDAGYGTVSVDIPPQKVAEGVVVLQVVEGRIAKLRVTGARWYSQDRILATVPALAEGQVPNLPDVQKQLVAVNTTLDKRVTPLLRPGKAPGTTEVDLQVEDSLPLHGSLELNNHHAANSTDTRLSGSLRYGNIAQLEHTLGLQFQLSPEKPAEVKVFGATYSAPLWGGTLIASATRSDSSSQAATGVGVLGKGQVYGLHMVWPLADAPAATDLYQTLNIGIDLKHSRQDLALQDGTGFSTPIRYAPLSISWMAQRTDASGATDANVGLSFGVRNLASHEQEFADKRYLALSDFVVLKAGLGRTQKLPGDFSLSLRVDAQGASQPLVSNEQYVAGGADTVRGYLESAAVGDTALRSGLELRTPNLPHLSPWLTEWRARVFAEGAYLRTLSPLPGTPAAVTLASVGLGMTLVTHERCQLRGDLAWPLRTVGTQLAYSPRLQAAAACDF